MKILVLSFYYPPDLGAGSFRSAAFVAALEKLLPKESHIDVLTTLPNRYSTYTARAEEVEHKNGVTIRRIQLPVHRSGLLDQAKAFTKFAWGSLSYIRNREYDLVFATSARTFTATLGAWCARKKRAPLYLDIRDIFNDAISSAVSRGTSMLLMPVLKLMERRTIESAIKVNLVSEGFLDYFSSRYPEQTFAVVPNGVDLEFNNVSPPHAAAAETGIRTIVYAGNIGQGQGLHHILPDLAERAQEKYQFLIIGDGGAKPELEHILSERRLSNVVLLPPVQRSDLLQYYDSADVLFLHLNDIPAFKRVLPSKLFEYAATGKPVLAGVAGYPAEFIKGNIENAAVFKPCDSEDGWTALAALKERSTDRSEFVSKFQRNVLMRTLAEDVIRCAERQFKSCLNK